ncbi:MAG: RidA family protein [Caulobacterales bacterium]|nr:RidA family protein [Caulobacterales bacterium]
MTVSVWRVAPLALLLAAPAAAQDIERFAPVGLPDGLSGLPFSEMVAHGDTLYVAGVIGFDPETDAPAEGVENQTRLALEAFEATVARAGADRSHVLSCTVFLADMADYGAMNAAFGAFFGEHKPARATLQATPPLGAATEIACIAARPPAPSEEP